MNREGLEYLFGTEVRDANHNYKLACPFHDEVTPSFLIRKDTGQAHCFGCGYSGTIVTAVRDYCKVSFDEAARLVRNEAGFRLVEGILRRRETQRCLIDPQVFPESWLAAWPKKIHKSILERGLSVDILRKSGTRYDYEHGGRQVFPHRNERGALVGVAGRGCAGQDPKWLFYWGYSKGRSLYYGTSEDGDQRDPIVTSKACKPSIVVVEGVFDVLWFQQHGISNVVGILGSKPSKYQIAELRNYDNIIIALDNDAAGKEGSERLYKALRRSANLKFANWPEEANDAMDLNGEELWELINTAESYLQRKLAKSVHR